MRTSCIVTSASVLLALASQAFAQKPAPTPTFANDIKPILVARCVVCHNHEALSNAATSGGLDLETYDALKRGVVGKDGSRSVIVIGKSPGGSLLDRLNTTSPTRMMPRGGPPLPPAQIALFKQWLTLGAPSGSLNPSAAVRSASILPGPMPYIAGVQNVSFAVRVKPAAEMLPVPPPKDPSLSLALKVGPVPAVTALAYSPDGSLLAVGGYRNVTLWNTKTAHPAGTISHLAGPVQSIAFKPDGAQIAVAGGLAGTPGEVKVFDVKSLSPVGDPLKGHTETVLCVTWSPDGTRIATASQDRSARVWQWPGGKEQQNFKDHGDAVTRVCFSPDGKSLYTASLDHNLRRFELDKGTLTRTFSGHAEGVNALGVSLDGKRLVSAGTEPTLKWWNADTGDVTNNSGGHGGPVNELAVSRDGKLVVSVSADKTARVWDAGSTGQQRALEGSSDWVYAVAISPDSKFTAASGIDGIVRIWETANGRLRLMLLSWVLEKSSAPEWAAITPEGYFDASDAWAKLLSPTLTAGTAPVSLAAWVKTWRQPDSVTAAATGAQLEPPKPGK